MSYDRLGDHATFGASCTEIAMSSNNSIQVGWLSFFWYNLTPVPSVEGSCRGKGLAGQWKPGFTYNLRRTYCTHLLKEMRACFLIHTRTF